MSTNPRFNYNKFCLNGFIKVFPVLADAEPLAIHAWLELTVSAFSGRMGGGLGGFSDDLKCLLAAAYNVELEVCSAREIKNTLRIKLRGIIVNNDYEGLLYVARGFERAAAMAVIDYRDVEWCDPSHLKEDDEEDEIVIPVAIFEWFETLFEPSQARSVIGNHSRKRLRRKPAERAVKSLFEGDV